MKGKTWKGKTVFWAALFAVLAAGGIGVYTLRPAGTVAKVSVDGQLWETIDLAAVAAPYEKTVETPWGWNTVRVSPGAIQVVDADCPNHDCVEQGAISDGAIPIVCLPHRLVIEIERDE